MIPQLHGWEATKPPPWRWCVDAWHCGDAMPLAMRARAFNVDWRGWQGGSEWETFLLFLLNLPLSRTESLVWVKTPSQPDSFSFH